MVAEKSLYPILAKLFEDQGYDVLVNKFGIRPFQGGKLNFPDVFAYRWVGDDVDVAAVECKPYKPPFGMLSALPQAIEYMIFVGKTYISTPSGDLRALEILERLGIGYISIRERDALIVTAPNPSKFGLLDQTGHVLQVRSRTKLLLAWHEYTGMTNFGMGTPTDVDMWVATPIHGAIQHNAWLVSADGVFRSGLNLEHKETIAASFAGWTRERTSKLAKILHALPQGYEIRVWPIRSRPFAEEPNLLRKRAADVAISDVERLVADVRRTLRRPQWKPHISVNRELWPVESDVARSQAVGTLRRVREEITPLADSLALRSEAH